MKTRAFKIIKRIVLGGLLAVGLFFATIFTIMYFRFTPTIFDRPSNLTEQRETIDVSYINWACDCPNFIESKYYKSNPGYETKEEDCIFIESANAEVKIPDSYYDKGHFEKKLRLTGQFYQDKGIPSSYEMKTVGEKPSKAKVFRYDKVEYINYDR